MIKSMAIMLALAASLPSAAIAAGDNIDVSADPAAPQSRAVSADGLDLTRASGQAILRTRVTYAVRQLCGTAGSTGPLMPAEKACAADAMAAANRQAEVLIATASRQANAVTVHSAN